MNTSETTEERLATEMVAAIQRGITNGDTSSLSRLLTKHQTKQEVTMTSVTLVCLAQTLLTEVSKLRRRCEILEARPMPKWAGAWSGLEKYQPLEFVVDHGSLWVCKAEHVSQRPGSGDSAAAYWQLCSKGDRR